MFNGRGEIFMVQEIRNKYCAHFNTMQYNSLTTAIPKQWKHMCKHSVHTKVEIWTNIKI